MFGIEFLPRSLHEDKITIQLMREGALAYLKKQVDFILIPTNPRQVPSVDSLLASYALKQAIDDISFIPTLSGAHYVGQSGVEQFYAQLLALRYANFKHIAIIGGERHHKESMTSKAMIHAIRQELGEEIYIISGSGSLEDNIGKAKLQEKLQAGVNAIITQPLFEAKTARAFLKTFRDITHTGGYEVQVFLGVFGIFHIKSALSINEANLGFKIPQSYIESMGSNQAKQSYERLWQDMQQVAKEYQASLYLSTPKHNDLRAYGG